MPYSQTIELEGAPELPNALRRLHWRDRAGHSLYWRTYIARLLLNSAPEKPLERSRVLIEVWRKGEPDPDNLVASVKPLIDGLQPRSVLKRRGRLYPQPGAGVIANDRAANFEGGRAEVVFHRCTRGECPRVRITVEEVQ